MTAAPPLLARIPAAAFASVMGVSGLGLAWRHAGRTETLPVWPGEAILALGLGLLCALLLAYGAKLARHPQAVLAELSHPVKSAFIPAMTIALMLNAAAVHPLAPGLALGLWAAGAALHLALTIKVLLGWIIRKHDIAHASPAWFIPVVGTIIAPLMGVRLGQVELSWFFFSIGIGLWLPMLALILNRLVFHDDLPPKLMPTLFILIAPPAVGYLSYCALTGAEDAFARILVNLAVFLVLALLVLAPRLVRLPFALPWWAYTFPLDAAALAVAEHAERSGSALFGALALPLLALASVTVAVVLVRSALALRAGTLFAPE